MQIEKIKEGKKNGKKERKEEAWGQENKNILENT